VKYSIDNRAPVTHIPISRTKEGFLLIEAISAIALCTLISFLIAHYQATMLIWYHDGLRRLEAVTLIENYCEQYKAQNRAENIAGSGPVIREKRVNNFVITQQLLPSTQAGFYPARITIAWRSMQNKEEKIVVYTGVAHASSKKS